MPAGMYINPGMPTPSAPQFGGGINAPKGPFSFNPNQPPKPIAPNHPGGTGTIGWSGPSAPAGYAGAGAIRPTGPSSGFDPSYLQNLATNEGQLFARPSTGLSFNPLGNLGDVAGTPNLGGGNAPGQGLAPTYLQNALAANPFFTPQAAPAGTATPIAPPKGVGGQNQNLPPWIQAMMGNGSLGDTFGGV